MVLIQYTYIQHDELILSHNNVLTTLIIKKSSTDINVLTLALVLMQYWIVSYFYDSVSNDEKVIFQQNMQNAHK